MYPLNRRYVTNIVFVEGVACPALHIQFFNLYGYANTAFSFCVLLSVNAQCTLQRYAIWDKPAAFILLFYSIWLALPSSSYSDIFLLPLISFGEDKTSLHFSVFLAVSLGTGVDTCATRYDGVV